MKIEVIGEMVDNEDGSGSVELDCDEEGKQYLMQLGFEVLLMRGIEAEDKRKEAYGSIR